MGRVDVGAPQNWWTDDAIANAVNVTGEPWPVTSPTDKDARDGYQIERDAELERLRKVFAERQIPT